MHEMAYAVGASFFHVYGELVDVRTIVDVGASDLNGSLRSCAPKQATFVGLDTEPGPGVNLLVVPGEPFPLPDQCADLVLSTSCLEHDSMYWLTFLEMARILRPGGFLYVNVPSKGPYHAHPVDCWRFMPDAGKALSGWARRSGYDLRLYESFSPSKPDDLWGDLVMIFSSERTSRVTAPLASFLASSSVTLTKIG